MVFILCGASHANTSSRAPGNVHVQVKTDSTVTKMLSLKPALAAIAARNYTVQSNKGIVFGHEQIDQTGLPLAHYLATNKARLLIDQAKSRTLKGNTEIGITNRYIHPAAAVALATKRQTNNNPGVFFTINIIVVLEMRRAGR